MRFFTLLLLCGLISSSLYGQKLKDEKFQIEFLRLPTKTWPDDQKTYSYDFSKAGDNLRAVGLTETSYANNVKLNDFRKVDYGHVQISVSGAGFNSISSKAVKHTAKTKDKEGNEKEVVDYTYDYSYSVPVSVVIRDHTGKIILEKNVGGETKSSQVKSSRAVGRKVILNDVAARFKTEDAAKEAFKKAEATIKKNAVAASMTEALNTALGDFRKQYDLVGQKQSLILEIPVDKKLANAAAWETAVTDAVAVAKGIRTNVSFTNEAERLAGPIKFWKEELDKLTDKTDKKQRKLYYAAANNLATVYLILEDAENATKYAALLTEDMKMKSYEMEQIKKKVAALSTQMAIPGFTTRHFPIPDRSGVEPPAMPAAVAEAVAKKEAAKPKPMRYDTLKAYVIKEEGGEKITGTIRLPKGKPLFQKYRKEIKFWNAAGEAVSLNPENVYELGFGQTTLVTRDRPTGNTGLKKRASYLEVDTDAGEIRLLTLIPYYDDQTPVVTEFIDLPKEDKTIALAFTNPRWLNWRKSFAELFADCPVLYAEIRVGYYKNSVRDVRKALQAYKNKPCE